MEVQKRKQLGLVLKNGLKTIHKYKNEQIHTDWDWASTDSDIKETHKILGIADFKAQKRLRDEEIKQERKEKARKARGRHSPFKQLRSPKKRTATANLAFSKSMPATMNLTRELPPVLSLTSSNTSISTNRQLSSTTGPAGFHTPIRSKQKHGMVFHTS